MRTRRDWRWGHVQRGPSDAIVALSNAVFRPLPPARRWLGRCSKAVARRSMLIDNACERGGETRRVRRARNAAFRNCQRRYLPIPRSRPMAVCAPRPRRPRMARRMANGGRAPFDVNRQRLRVRRRGAACEKRTERGFQELSKALPTDPAFNFDGGLRARPRRAQRRLHIA